MNAKAMERRDENEYRLKQRMLLLDEYRLQLWTPRTYRRKVAKLDGEMEERPSSSSGYQSDPWEEWD